MTIKLLTGGIKDAPTAQAFRQIQLEINEALAAIDVRTTVVESGVSSVTSASGLLTASPTTGAVVLNLDLSGYSLVGHTHPQSDITGLVADLALKVPTSRLINTTAPLSGGGSLASDLTLTILNDGITDALLRNSAGLSVVGRSANTTGDPADIVAGSDGDVLRRSGTSLGFGAVPASSITGLVSDLAARPTGSGTSGRSARWTGTSTLATGAFTDDGTNAESNGTLSALGNIYLGGNELHFRFGTASNDTGYINYFSDGPTGTGYFRNLVVADGKGATIAQFTGSSKETTLGGKLLGLSGYFAGLASDAHTLDVYNGASTTSGLHVQGTSDGSYFLYGANEDVYIRGGVAASFVAVGDTGTGGVLLGTATNHTTVRGTLTVDYSANVAPGTGVTGGYRIGTGDVLYRSTGTGHLHLTNYYNTGGSGFYDVIVHPSSTQGSAWLSTTGGTVQLSYTGATLVSGDMTLGGDLYVNGGRLSLEPVAGTQTQMDWRQAGQTQWTLYQPGFNNDFHVWNSVSGNTLTFTNAMDATFGRDLTVTRDLYVNGGLVMGNSGADTHYMFGTLNANSTAGSNGQVLTVVSGVPQWAAPATSGTVTGTGTSGKLAKFTGTSSIGDSLVSESGSTVTVTGGLAVAAGSVNCSISVDSGSQLLLDAVTTIRSSGGSAHPSLRFINDSSQTWTIHEEMSGTGHLRITDTTDSSSIAVKIDTGTQFVALGSSAAVPERLYVAGNVRATGTLGAEDGFKAGTSAGTRVYTKIGRQFRTNGSGGANYNPTAGTKAVLLRMVGGGGGGGGTGTGGGVGAAAGAGGNSGWYVEQWICPGSGTAITGGAWSAGAAGAAGSSSGGAGGTGGDTSVVINGVTYTAKGGTGGGGMSRAASNQFAGQGIPAGGSSAGDFQMYEAGDPGISTDGGLYAYGGKGGSCPLGGGGGDSNFSLPVSGYGGGGGGGSTATVGKAGTAGGEGLIIIEEYA